MIRRRHLGLLGVAALARPAAAADPRWPNAIVIATASPGGTYHAYGVGLARILTRELGIAVSIRETSGPAENLRLIEESQAQIGFVTTGAVMEARAERGAARALFAMYDTPFHFVVRRDSPIRSVVELAGKTVAVGPAGGTGADYVPRMLAALGAEIRPANGSWADLAARFRVGEIDAIAVAAGVPFPAIADLEARRAIRYIPITRDQVARIRLVAPELTASSIPAGTYPSLMTPYETVGLFNIAIARQDMVPSLAFEIVRDVFEFHAEMMEAHPAAAATVPGNFVRNTVLPWHPGAMRYYGSRAVTGVLTGD